MKDMHEDDRHADAAARRARAHLAAAVAAIDERFGPGHARDNPALVASVVQAAAIESAVIAGQAASAESLSVVQRLARETNETILKLKPRLFG